MSNLEPDLSGLEGFVFFNFNGITKFFMKDQSKWIQV